MKKRMLLILLALFVVIQAFRPGKNHSADNTSDISVNYEVPDTIAILLDGACKNCHSNYTEYPWYAEIQPLGWWLNSHINEGKRHLNMSDFTGAPVAIQNHRFDEMIDMIRDKEMPLPSYTWFGLHPEAHLTDGQRDLLRSWAAAQMDTLKAHYPPDSLVMPRRRERIGV